MEVGALNVGLIHTKGLWRLLAWRYFELTTNKAYLHVDINSNLGNTLYSMNCVGSVQLGLI